MSERLIGQAERDMLGNDLFWRFLKYDDGMPGARIASRLGGACERIEVTGPDRRLR